MFNIRFISQNSCKTAIIIYSSFINQLIIQSLEWTQSTTYETKPFSSFRSRIYEFLDKYFIICGINCNFTELEIKILIKDQLINDIKPVEQTLKVFLFLF
jgi:hypothetical protein